MTLCRFTDSGACAAKTPEACVCNQETFLIFGLAKVTPEQLHNYLADVLGEPWDKAKITTFKEAPHEYTYPRRNLRKDNRVPPETPGGVSDDGSSPKRKQ